MIQTILVLSCVPSVILNPSSVPARDRVEKVTVIVRDINCTRSLSASQLVLVLIVYRDNASTTSKDTKIIDKLTYDLFFLNPHKLWKKLKFTKVSENLVRLERGNY